MIYDHQVNMSEVHAPVQANIMVRSQSEQRPKKSSQKATVRNACLLYTSDAADE